MKISYSIWTLSFSTPLISEVYLNPSFLSNYIHLDISMEGSTPTGLPKQTILLEHSGTKQNTTI